MSRKRDNGTLAAQLIDGAYAEKVLDALSKGGTYKNAAFMIQPNGTFGIFIRSGATRREILHEIGHLLTFKHLGNADDYSKLGKPLREHLAASFVLSRKGPLNRLTLQEVVQETGSILKRPSLDDRILDLLRKWGIEP